MLDCQFMGRKDSYCELSTVWSSLLYWIYIWHNGLEVLQWNNFANAIKCDVFVVSGHEGRRWWMWWSMIPMMRGSTKRKPCRTPLRTTITMMQWTISTLRKIKYMCSQLSFWVLEMTVCIFEKLIFQFLWIKHDDVDFKTEIGLKRVSWDFACTDNGGLILKQCNEYFLFSGAMHYTCYNLNNLNLQHQSFFSFI